MNAFEIIGVVTVIWALIVAFLGITREGFPNSDGTVRATIAISVALAIACVTLAAITGAEEAHERDSEEAALSR